MSNLQNITDLTNKKRENLFTLSFFIYNLGQSPLGGNPQLNLRRSTKVSTNNVREANNICS